MTNKEESLAVVVPAYKAAFLEKSLESMLVQKDSNTTIYVFDDASPQAVASVAAKFGNGLVYRRFEENLGGIDLAAHWNRCIDETTEDWIWLFSDDDIADSGCIPAFRRQEAASSLYRFDTKIINQNGDVVEYNVPHPETENNLDYAYYRFMKKRSTTAVEYIFSREAYEKVGKFESFPLAWGSDVSMWIKLAQEGGIQTIRGPVVGWRQSDLNLSPDTGRNASRKIDGSAKFYEWTKDYFTGRYADDPKHPLLMRALDDWIRQHILNQAAYLPVLKGLKVMRERRKYLGKRATGRLSAIMVAKHFSKKIQRFLR